MESHRMIRSSPKKRRFFSCTNPIESLRCLQCTNFGTHKLVDLKQHRQANHMLVDSTEKLHECDKCNFRTHSNYLFWRHTLFNLCMTDGKIKLQLKEDNDYKTWLESHINSVDSRTLKTEERPKRFHCADKSLNSRLNKTHEKRAIKNIHMCNYCSYETTHTGSLNRHILNKHTHSSKIKWFDCDHCPYKGKTKTNLKGHTDRKHGNMTKLTCEHCQFQTKYKKKLEVHLLTRHTNPDTIQWFQCEHCSYKGKTKSHLKQHTDNKHVNKTKLQCCHCDFETKYKKILKGHLLKHANPHNERKMKCDFCQFETKFKTGLKRHVLAKHTDPDQ